MWEFLFFVELQIYLWIMYFFIDSECWEVEDERWWPNFEDVIRELIRISLERIIN